MYIYVHIHIHIYRVFRNSRHISEILDIKTEVNTYRSIFETYVYKDTKSSEQKSPKSVIQLLLLSVRPIHFFD